jgi:hypothetical protein
MREAIGGNALKRPARGGVARDNQGETPTSIKMRLTWRRADGGEGVARP